MTERKTMEKKAAGPKQLSIAAGERIHIVFTSDQLVARHILEAQEDGTIRVYAEPVPAPPVQDPDPISDPSQMQKPGEK